MKDDKQLKAEIKATIGEFAAAYEKRRLDKLAPLFAPDSRVVTLGANAAELEANVTDLKAAFQHEWANHNAEAMRFGAEKISAEGSRAYVEADAILYREAGSRHEAVKAKFTAGLERSGDKWQFNQMHFSLPAEEAAAHASAGHAAAHAAKGYTAAAYAASEKTNRLEK